MTHSNHTQMDRWRIVVPGRTASEVLVHASHGAFLLPEVLVPRNQRLAWHLNEQVRLNWRLPSLSIVPINSKTKTGEANLAQYHVAELIFPIAALPSGLKWANVASLTAEAFHHSEDFEAVDTYFHTSSRSATGDGPFARIGWFEDLSKWVRSIALSRELEWNGRFEQFHAAACFSLIRFETLPHALWFKAVGEPNTREFHITQVLASRLRDFVPRLLAVRPDCNGWLAGECPGSVLHDVSETDLWRKAAGTLAQLQIASVSHVEELLRAGAHQLESVLSDSAIERFVRAGSALFSEASDRDALDPTHDDLKEVAFRARECFDRVKALHIPDALGHLDLNSGNIVVSREKSTYLDWAEAYVGFPFLTFEYLLQAYRRKFGRESQDETCVVDTYLTAWEGFLPRSTIREAWTRTSFLALFAYALRCIAASEPHLNRAEGLAKYVRSLLRKLNREVENFPTSAVGVTR